MPGTLKRLAIATVTMTAAAMLAGCATSPRPFSIEEAVWFHKASEEEKPTGYPLPLDAPYAHYGRYAPSPDYARAPAYAPEPAYASPSGYDSSTPGEPPPFVPPPPGN